MRCCVFVALLVCLFLSGLAATWIGIVFAEHRGRDFTDASKTDFTNLGTCVERITDEQLKEKHYNSPSTSRDEECNKESASDAGGIKTMYQNTLSASVHALYWAVKSGGDPALDLVARSTITATLGIANAPGINMSIAYTVLSQLKDTPATCDKIYPAQADGDFNVATVKKPDVLCDMAKTAVAGSSPVEYEYVTPATDPEGRVAWADITDAANLQFLYRHCVRQFSYGRTGTDHGSFYVPILHSDTPSPGPVWAPYGPIEGWNLTAASLDATWPASARVHNGLRFGWAMFAYVPMTVTIAFLFVDCVVFLLAEIARPGLFIAQVTSGETTVRGKIADAIIMVVTISSRRNNRLILGGVGVFVSILLYAVYIAIPWSFGSRLHRPICDVGAGPDTLGFLFYNAAKSSYGGWRPDVDATVMEIAALGVMLLVLFILPCTRAVREDSGPANRNGLPNQKLDDADGTTGVQSQSLWMKWWIPIAIIGGLVVLVGQAFVAAYFGYTWTVAVAGLKSFNPVTVGTTIFTTCWHTMVVAVVVGAYVAALNGRWMIPGNTCEAFVVFLIWCFITVCIFIPVFTIFLADAFDYDKQREECDELFVPATDYPVVSEACTIRQWTFIVGFGIIALVSAGVLINGLIWGLPATFKQKTRGVGRVPNVVRTLTRGNRLTEPSRAHLGGFRSADENFYNFATALSAEQEQSQRLLSPSPVAEQACAAPGPPPKVSFHLNIPKK